MLAAIVVLGAALRFSTLSRQSFWVDEAYTHAIVVKGLGPALATIPKTESTPPLYYFLLWFWARVFGTGEAGLRSFSALCGTVTIPVLYLLGRRLVSERVGLLAALLAAVSPILFWYSQEARAYALLVLLCALTLLALLRASAAPTPGRLLSWGLVAAVALATHYFAGIVIVPEAVWLLCTLRRRRDAPLGRLAVAYAPVLAVGAALLPLLIHQDDGRAGFLSTSGSAPKRLAQLVKQHAIGYSAPADVALSAVAMAALAVALGLLVVRVRPTERRAVLLPVVVSVGGLVLAVLPALITTDLVDSRNLLGLWPAEALVAAIGFGATGAGRLGLAAAAALAAVSLAVIVGQEADPLYQRSDWRGAARALGPAASNRLIVMPDQGGDLALTPYLGSLRTLSVGADPVEEIDVIGVDTAPGSPPVRPRIPATLPGFALVERVETEGYTVLRYRSPVPREESPSAVLPLALGRGYWPVLQTARH